jgi:Uma2 family endonuclease
MPLHCIDEIKSEKINGIVYNMSPSGGFKHCQINGNLHLILAQQLKGSVCFVSVENFNLYFSNDDYVIPDIMLICDRSQIKRDKYRGVPRFIAETLSPSTALKDRTVKKEKYAALGVDEYWIISPRERSVEVHYLENGYYRLVASHILVDDEEDENYNADTILTLKAMPHISVPLKDIFDHIE